MGLLNRRLSIADATAIKGGQIASSLQPINNSRIKLEPNKRLVLFDKNNYAAANYASLLPEEVMDALRTAQNTLGKPIIDENGLRTPGTTDVDLKKAVGQVRQNIIGAALKSPLTNVFFQEMQEADMNRTPAEKAALNSNPHEKFWTSYDGKKLGNSVVEDLAALIATDFSVNAEKRLEFEEAMDPDKVSSREMASTVKHQSEKFAKNVTGIDTVFNEALQERAYISDSEGKRFVDQNGKFVRSKSNGEILRENLALEVIKANKKSNKLTDKAFVSPTNPLGIDPAKQAFVDTEVTKYIDALKVRVHRDAVVRAHNRNFNQANPGDNILQEVCIASHPVVKIQGSTSNPNQIELELKEKTFDQVGRPGGVIPGVTYTVAEVEHPAELGMGVYGKSIGTQKAFVHFVEEIQHKTEGGMSLDQAIGEAVKSSLEFQSTLTKLTFLKRIGVPKFITEGMLQDKLGKSFPKIVQAIIANPEEFLKSQIKEDLKDKALEKGLKLIGVIQEREFEDGRKREINVLTSVPHQVGANIFNKLFLDRVDKQIEEGNLELTGLLGNGANTQSAWERINILKLKLWKKNKDREMLEDRRDNDQGIFAPMISAITYLVKSAANQVIYEVAARSQFARKIVTFADEAKAFLDNPLAHIIERSEGLQKLANGFNQVKGIAGAFGKGVARGGIVGVTAYFILGGTPTALVFAGGIAAAQAINSFGRDLVSLKNKNVLSAVPGLFKERTLLAVDNPILKFIAGKAGNQISPLTRISSIKVEGRLLSSLEGFNLGTIAAGLVFLLTGSPVGALVTGVGVGAGNYLLKQKIAPYLKQSLAELKNSFDITARLQGLPAKLMKFPILDALWTGMSINELTNLSRDFIRMQRGEMTADQFNNMYGFGSTLGVFANIGFSTAQTAIGLLAISRFASIAMKILPSLVGNISIAMNTVKVFSSTNPLGLAITAIGTVVGFGIGLLTGNMTGALIGAWVGGIAGAFIGGLLGNVPGALIGAVAGSAIVGGIGAGIEGWLKDKLGGLYDRAMGLLGAAMGAIALLKATNLKERVEAFVAIGSTMMVFGSVAGTLLLAGATFTPGNAAQPISDISVSKKFIGKNEDGSLRYRLTIAKSTLDISSADILFKDDINNFTSEVGSIEIIKDTIGVSVQGKSVNLPKKTFTNFTSLLTEYDVKLNKPLDQFLKEGDNICNTIQGEMVFSIVPAEKDKAPKIKVEEIKPETRTFNQTVCIDKDGREKRKSSDNRKLFVDNGGLPVNADLGSVTQCSFAIGGGGSHDRYPALDIGAGLGVDVTPILDGKVILTSYQVNGYGQYIKVLHKTAVGNMITTYAHLSQILVNEEEEVTKTTVIGKVGSTGNSTGPHLHFETNLNGKSVEPCCIINCTSYIRSSISRAFSCNVKGSAFYSDPRTQCNL